MTQSLLKDKTCKNSASSLRGMTRLVLSLLCIFTFLLLMKNPRLAASCMSGGLSVCARVIIPTLFPFMVLSELAVSTGAHRLISPLFRLPVKLLFRMRGECAAAMVLGFLCGFPVGAKSASALYRQGEIDRWEYETLISIVSIPSPAFLIGSVGLYSFGSAKTGILLYSVTLVSAVVSGIIISAVMRKKAPRTQSSSGRSFSTRETGALSAVASAISSAVPSMLNVCAFILFFFTVVGAVDAALAPLCLPDGIRAVIFGIFEISGGMTVASESGEWGICVAALLCGLSGASVCMQVTGICEKDGISLKAFMISRLIIAALNLLITVMLRPIFL